MDDFGNDILFYNVYGNDETYVSVAAYGGLYFWVIDSEVQDV